MKLLRILLWCQGLYYLATGLWPLIDVKSFMIITGYKTDIWLVKTVGALIIPIALTILSNLFIRTNPLPALILCLSSAIAFTSIDLYYSLTDVINDVYQVDAVLQVCFALTAIISLINVSRSRISTL